MKPFLKWAGGKAKLVDILSEELGSARRLVEPFAGSGAVFMGTNFSNYLLCDANNDLIQLYDNLKNHTDQLLCEVKELFKLQNNTDAQFRILKNEFNTIDSGIRKSSLFVYLNRHSFNGLCRYNSTGGYNVPFGKYKTTFAPIENMKNFAAKSSVAEFKCVDFKDCFALVQSGDVVYCDPPYVPLTKSANFTSYHKNSFGIEQQRELVRCIEQVNKNSVKVVVSNHDTVETRELYKNARIREIDVRRTISSKSASRGSVKEIIAIFEGN
jgi:DNA adenine methylase